MTIPAARIYEQVKTITADLIGLSLCNEQKFPSLTSWAGGMSEVSFSGADKLSIVLKNTPYQLIYRELDITQTYNIKMVDGALIQLMYRFHNDRLISHRLAYFPSPDLLEFQNHSDVYETDDIYAEVVMKNLVAFPLRFDYDASEKVFEELHHPRSHLTLGQYKNCRIPVSAPVTPFKFMDFVLRSFYNTSHRKFCVSMTNFEDRFDGTITPIEMGVLHISAATVPLGASK